VLYQVVAGVGYYIGRALDRFALPVLEYRTTYLVDITQIASAQALYGLIRAKWPVPFWQYYFLGIRHTLAPYSPTLFHKRRHSVLVRGRGAENTPRQGANASQHGAQTAQGRTPLARFGPARYLI